jgi:hypothetical protein
MPDAGWAACKLAPCLIPGSKFIPGFDVIWTFRHVISGSLAFVSSTLT